MKARVRLRHDKRGAVLVEFAVAMMPLFLTFFCGIQVTMMITGKLVVRHAAIVAARAGAVITGGEATNPGTNAKEQGTEGDPKQAGIDALGTWGDNGILSAIVDVQDPGGVNGEVVADVTATFTCVTPLAGPIVCPGGSLTMHEVASMPKQGAEYKE